MKVFFSILFLLLFFSVHAQIIIKGKVIDKQHLPLPYVNVIVKNTIIGTSTNPKGNFKITLKKNKGILEFSYMGYFSLIKKVNAKTKFLTITLKEKENQLGEVVIVTRPKKRLPKKQNPAYRILKEIWKHKKSNGLKLVNYYQYKKNKTLEIALNHLDSISLKRLFNKKDYKRLADDIEYEPDGITRYLPIYINEEISNIYGDNTRKKERIDIEAKKHKGLLIKGFTFDRMSNAFRNIDVYNNNIIIFRKSFVSPISTTGFDTYDYVLNDSTTVNHKKLYNIYFFPRRNQDLAFKGNFWVTDKIFSITRIQMKVSKNANLNFLKSLNFRKEFTIKNDSVYLPKVNAYEGEFTISSKRKKTKRFGGITIKKISIYTNYILDKPKQKSFYEKKIVEYSPKQFSKPEEYWKKNGKKENQDIYKNIGRIKNTKKIKTFTSLLNTIITGYITLTPFLQVGPFWTFFANNEVEGFRIKTGFRSFKTVNDRFRINGYVAYGTKDKKLKFGIESKYLLSRNPRISAGISYVYDFKQLGSKLLNTNQLMENTFGDVALLSRGNNFYISKVNKIATNLNYQIKKNINVGVNFTSNNITSAAPDLFSIDYLKKDNTLVSNVKDVATDLYLSLTPGRIIYGLGVEQLYGRNLFPTIILNYRKGYKGLLGGTSNYNRLQFSYNQPITLGKLGLLDATIEGGKTFGTVPLSLLNPVPANQTFSLVKNTFSLLNYYDFVTDTYITTHLEHHFNGLILNRIPLLRKLKLRSLVTFRAVYGTISNDNKSINRSSIIYNAPSNQIYYEYGIGLENIGIGNVRPLRVDAIWRSNYRALNTEIAQPPMFALRIGITPEL